MRTCRLDISAFQMPQEAAGCFSVTSSSWRGLSALNKNDCTEPWVWPTHTQRGDTAAPSTVTAVLNLSGPSSSVLQASKKTSTRFVRRAVCCVVLATGASRNPLPLPASWRPPLLPFKSAHVNRKDNLALSLEWDATTARF